jgi:hypothetical protein
MFLSPIAGADTARVRGWHNGGMPRPMVNIAASSADPEAGVSGRNRALFSFLLQIDNNDWITELKYNTDA